MKNTTDSSSIFAIAPGKLGVSRCQEKSLFEGSGITEWNGMSRVESFQSLSCRATLSMVKRGGNAQAAGNNRLVSELARLCRETIKEDPKERRAAVLAEAAEAGKSIREARRSSVIYKTKMNCLHHPDGTVTAYRREMEKVIYGFYSDL
uniref:Uncharacterized protein n=1 Tax=Haemonchus contortus TaxID=6289 RepID=A0A7I4YCX0_HAECO